MRVSSVPRDEPAAAIVEEHRLGRLSGTGWAVGYIGGLVSLLLMLGFLVGDPRLYTSNWAFWTKMGLILLAGLNFLFYYKKVEPQLLKLGPQDETPGLAKVVGAASLLFWFGVLSLGRLLPYLGPGGG